uniref:Uncharacterized protein n=1 Tax=Physcomitrium patens TaxID=3218 RepID=A0A2K1J0Q8_PHYPA|nr:hypothetical protein PHYPA_023014 [Physcomitrium patens]
MEKSGWTGGLNYYRNLTKSHELKAPWTNARLKSDALYIVGDQDAVLQFPGMQRICGQAYEGVCAEFEGCRVREEGTFHSSGAALSRYRPPPRLLHRPLLFFPSFPMIMPHCMPRVYVSLRNYVYLYISVSIYYMYLYIYIYI